MTEYVWEIREEIKIKLNEKSPSKYAFASSIVKDHSIIRTWHHNLKVEFLFYLLNKFKDKIPQSIYSELEKECKDLRYVKKGDETLFSDYNDIIDVLVKLPKALEYLTFKGVDLIELQSKLKLLKYVSKGEVYTADLMNLINSIFELLYRIRWGGLYQIYESPFFLEEIDMSGNKEPISIYKMFSEKLAINLGLSLFYSERVPMNINLGSSYSDKIELQIKLGSSYLNNI